MHATTHLVPIHNSQIVAFTEDDKHYVAVKPICETMGIAWNAQFEKLNRDDLFKSVIRVIRTTGSDGKQYEMVCLPLEMFPMWLAKIDSRRIQNAQAQKFVLMFQQEAARVLYEYFFGGGLSKDMVSGYERKLREKSASIIRLFIGKLFRNNEADFQLARWAYRMKFLGSYKDMAAYAGCSAGRLSTLRRKYDHYLDGTRNERHYLPKHAHDHVFPAELYHLLAQHFESYEHFKKQLRLRDWIFEEPAKYIDREARPKAFQPTHNYLEGGA